MCDNKSETNFGATTQASKNCVPNWEQIHIWHPNFIEEPKILGTLLLCHIVF